MGLHLLYVYCMHSGCANLSWSLNCHLIFKPASTLCSHVVIFWIFFLSFYSAFQQHYILLFLLPCKVHRQKQSGSCVSCSLTLTKSLERFPSSLLVLMSKPCVLEQEPCVAPEEPFEAPQESSSPAEMSQKTFFFFFLHLSVCGRGNDGVIVSPVELTVTKCFDTSWKPWCFDRVR